VGLQANKDVGASALSHPIFPALKWTSDLREAIDSSELTPSPNNDSGNGAAAKKL